MNQDERYLPRIVDTQIALYLRLFGALEVAGTKWCGKTWSSLAHSSSVFYVDRGANLRITEADPQVALAGDRPHVIDEWQRVPAIWDTVRHAVDESAGAKGQWILTGSATPAKDEVSHSGAGRIGRIRMWPMTLQESGDSVAKVSLRALFDGEFEAVQCPSGIMDLASVAVRGGWPEVVGATPEDAQTVASEYLNAIFSMSIPRLGGDGPMAERTAYSIARNLGQSTKINTLAKDVFALGGEEDVPSHQAEDVSRLLQLLKRVYLLDEIPGWVPASRSPLRMRVKPKRYFADPSLAAALLGFGVRGLLDEWQTFGLVFENLVMRDLQVYAQALGDTGRQPVKYYHDDSGLEVDAVIERNDRRWAAIEIKVSQDAVDAGAASLLRMKGKVLKNKAARVKEPSFLAVVTGMGEVAYQRNDGVYVIPIRALGA